LIFSPIKINDLQSQKIVKTPFSTASLATMKFLLASVFGILLIPSIAIAQTHCAKEEVEYFSCVAAAPNMVVSVCGNTGVGIGEDISENSWLQYRFGKIGHIELAYPKEKRDSIRKFEGIYFAKYGGSSLRFINDDALYIIEEWEKSSGLEVTLSNGKRIEIHCRTAKSEPSDNTDRPHQGSFMLLVNRLSELNTTDFQDLFINKYLRKKITR
jgi:hypothetical protein